MKGIDRLDPAYYTVAHGDGQTTTCPKQTSMWVAAQDLPRSAAHPFYTRLNQILDTADFDGHVETLCQRFYAADVGRPGLPPGRYFRMLLLGYFEGLDSERHRVADGGFVGRPFTTGC